MKHIVRITVRVLGAILAAGGALAASPFPSHVELPDGFRPEGIAIGRGSTFYVGSIRHRFDLPWRPPNRRR